MVRLRKWRVCTGTSWEMQRRGSISWRRKVKGHMIAELTGGLFILVSLNTRSKKPWKIQFTRDCACVEWCSPAVKLCLKHNRIFFFMADYYSSLVYLSLKAFEEKHINLAKRSTTRQLIEVKSLLTLIYWQRIKECMSVWVHLFIPRGRAQLLFVCLCLCSSTVQSVLRESQVICESKDKQIAELKKMSDQSVDSLKNEWEKKV